MPDVGPLDALLHRPRPSFLEQFCNGPVMFVTQRLYAWRRITTPSTCISPATIVCISDTHNQLIPIPPGDVLVHAGDLTQSGTRAEIQAALDWLRHQPHEHKIVIAGNHDLLLDSTSTGGQIDTCSERLEWGDVLYLEDESTTISLKTGRQLKIYGSPRSPRHGNWAFQYPREEDVWHGRVPMDTDVLISHSPPASHLDLGKAGCRALLEELWCVRPRLHVFGHIHAAYGQEWLQYDALQRAYEQIVQEAGGLWNLWRFLLLFTWNLLVSPEESQTLLVNASIIGGLRDEKRREPITVQI